MTPAFAGYVSGHSTFSRAAAEVMTAFTGDPYFPGGLSEWTVAAGGARDRSRADRGDVTLQWATYYDAADQAGISRIFGGIHITADDFAGRRIGSPAAGTPGPWRSATSRAPLVVRSYAVAGSTASARHSSRSASGCSTTMTSSTGRPPSLR